MQTLTYVHELLLRFDKDGLKGVHQCKAETILDDNGAVLVTKDLGASPLDLGSNEFKTIMDQATNDALAENGRLQAENLLLIQDKNSLLTENDELKRSYLQLQDQNKLLEARIGLLEASNGGA